MVYLEKYTTKNPMDASIIPGAIKKEWLSPFLFN
jgi:hypothetical protein